MHVMGTFAGMTCSDSLHKQLMVPSVPANQWILCYADDMKLYYTLAAV